MTRRERTVGTMHMRTSDNGPQGYALASDSSACGTCMWVWCGRSQGCAPARAGSAPPAAPQLVAREKYCLATQEGGHSRKQHVDDADRGNADAEAGAEGAAHGVTMPHAHRPLHACALGDWCCSAFAAESRAAWPCELQVPVEDGDCRRLQALGRRGMHACADTASRALACSRYQW